MRAVQTLWTANKNLLVDSFGWIHPQYNLMSWAFSCLSLKEHYEDVVMYTDSKGYAILHDYLKLPYKDIIVQYDNLDCHPIYGGTQNYLHILYKISLLFM